MFINILIVAILLYFYILTSTPRRLRRVDTHSKLHVLCAAAKNGDIHSPVAKVRFSYSQSVAALLTD